MFNVLLILFILAALSVFLRVILKRNALPPGLEEKERFSLQFLTKGIKESFDEISNMNLAKLNLNEADMEKRRKNRNNLRKALRTCGQGDAGAREFVKDYIRNLLQKKFGINENTIDRTIPFSRVEELNVQDKFEILFHFYQKQYGRKALEQLIVRYGLDKDRTDEAGRRKYRITARDIEGIYEREQPELTYLDKLEILTQRIFAMDKGNGAADELIYQKIDGVSGGVSGLCTDMYHYGDGKMEEEEVRKKLTFTYDSVWIMFRGKSIHLEFLSFGTEKELKRVCRNIYRYDAPGQLSQATGFIVNDLKSGARISDMRPPFAGSWCFWVRMFDSVERKEIEELYSQPGNRILKQVLQYIIRGEQTTVISGQQGTGKTTCLEALVAFIAPSYNIRTIELTFELRLQYVYPELNIAAMRETKTIPSEQAIEFVKKTDADVVIFGEIAKESEGEKLIKISQAGTKFTLSTQHGVTTKALVNWFRNALLHTGFQNEEAAERQVADAIRFDVHLRKKPDGERIIERITEIVPETEQKLPDDPMTAIREYLERKIKGSVYHTVDIVRYTDNGYELCNPFSPETCRQIVWNLNPKERKEFQSLFRIKEDYWNEGRNEVRICV